MSRMVKASATKNVLCDVRSLCVRACGANRRMEMMRFDWNPNKCIFSSYPQIKKNWKKNNWEWIECTVDGCLKINEWNGCIQHLFEHKCQSVRYKGEHPHGRAQYVYDNNESYAAVDLRVQPFNFSYNSSCSPRFDWFPTFWTWDFPIAYITPPYVCLFYLMHAMCARILSLRTRIEMKRKSSH